MATIFNVFFARILELLKIPFVNSEVTWTIIPIVITLFVVLIYFRKYKDEELGWNTAVANTLVTVFVSVELLKHIYFSGGANISNYTTYLPKTIMVLLFLFLGIILFLIDIEHALPKKIAYHLSSPLLIYVLAYVLISYVHSAVVFDKITILVLIALFIILRIILLGIEIPFDRLFNYISKVGRKEKFEDIKKAKKIIKQTKSELKAKKS